MPIPILTLFLIPPNGFMPVIRWGVGKVAPVVCGHVKVVQRVPRHAESPG